MPEASRETSRDSVEAFITLGSTNKPEREWRRRSLRRHARAVLGAATVPAMRTAALFDMDNTLLRIETGMSWVRFLRSRGELTARMVAKAMYWSAMYKLAV